MACFRQACWFISLQENCWILSVIHSLEFYFSCAESGFRSNAPHRLYASKFTFSSSFLSNSWIEGNRNNSLANSVVSVRPVVKLLEITFLHSSGVRSGVRLDSVNKVKHRHGRQEAHFPLNSLADL